MGLLIKHCDECGHYHSRFTGKRRGYPLGYCTEPKCACPLGPSPSVQARSKP